MEPGVKPVRWVVTHREGLLAIATVAVVMAAVFAVTSLLLEAY